jgi:hypothetical protein
MYRIHIIKLMDYAVEFGLEKNELLKSTRNIGFEEVIKCIQNSALLDNKIHHNKLRSNQRIYIVNINSYAYIVPYVIDEENKKILLKTIYPSRKYTKLYLRGELQ